MANPRRIALAVALCSAALLALNTLPWSQAQGVCADFNFSLTLAPHLASRWNASVRALNPHTPYNDRVVLTYHSDLKRLRLNNVECKLQLLGVRGMSPIQVQNIKPRLLVEAIRRSRARHLALIDWDANWLRWPPAPVSASPALLALGSPGGNEVVTGVMIFFQARSYLLLLSRWVALERDDRHDQSAWRELEARERFRRALLPDGLFVEHYSWNYINKIATVARCRFMISVVRVMRATLDAIGALTLLVCFFDSVSIVRQGRCARRPQLAVLAAIAVTLSLLFRGELQRVAADVHPYSSERVCAVPEIALSGEGAVVTRRSTTDGVNPVLVTLIAMLGLQHTASLLSLWVVLIDRARAFSRMIIFLEVLSACSLLITGPRARQESVIWIMSAYLVGFWKKLELPDAFSLFKRPRHSVGFERLLNRTVVRKSPNSD